MNHFDDNIYKNTDDINKNLVRLNELYKIRIKLLENELYNNSKSHSTDDINYKDESIDTEEKYKKILEDIKPALDKKDNSKSTSIRISTETKELLDKARLDFMNYYKKNLSYSQTILLLMEIYDKHNE